MTSFAEQYQVLFDSIGSRADVLTAKLAILRNGADADLLGKIQQVRVMIADGVPSLRGREFPVETSHEDREEFVIEFRFDIDYCLGYAEILTEQIARIAEHPKMHREIAMLLARGAELDDLAADQRLNFAFEAALQFARPRLTSEWETSGGPGQIAAKAISMVQAASRCRRRAKDIQREIDRDQFVEDAADDVDWSDAF